MKLKYILFILIIIALVTACAKPPVEEMELAREAVFKAENDADAVMYGSASLTRAREALRHMESEADSKRYDSAKILAAEAIMAAERAIEDGKTNSSRVVVESASFNGLDTTNGSSIVEGLRPEIEETTRNVNGARYSLLDLDYEALDNGLEKAHDMIDLAEIDQAEGRFQDALDKARTVRADLANINNQVTGAVTRRK